MLNFIQVPAHIWVEKNELADRDAKEATMKMEINMEIHYTGEVKSIIKSEMRK